MENMSANTAEKRRGTMDKTNYPTVAYKSPDDFVKDMAALCYLYPTEAARKIYIAKFGTDPADEIDDLSIGGSAQALKRRNGIAALLSETMEDAVFGGALGHWPPGSRRKVLRV